MADKIQVFTDWNTRKLFLVSAIVSASAAIIPDLIQAGDRVSTLRNISSIVFAINSLVLFLNFCFRTLVPLVEITDSIATFNKGIFNRKQIPKLEIKTVLTSENSIKITSTGSKVITISLRGMAIGDRESILKNLTH